MKRLKSLQKAEAYLEPRQVSTMNIFENILNGLLFRNKSFIIDIRLGHTQASENIEIFKVKLRWSKSLRLSQRIAFLILISICCKMCHIRKRFLFEILLFPCVKQKPVFSTRDAPIVLKKLVSTNAEELFAAVGTKVYKKSSFQLIKKIVPKF